MTDTQALPCPHCDTAPVETAIPAHSHSAWLKKRIPSLPDHPGSFTIECPLCGAGMIDETRDAVLARWNRRGRTASAILEPTMLAELRLIAAADAEGRTFRFRRMDATPERIEVWRRLANRDMIEQERSFETGDYLVRPTRIGRATLAVAERIEEGRSAPDQALQADRQRLLDGLSAIHAMAGRRPDVTGETSLALVRIRLNNLLEGYTHDRK